MRQERGTISLQIGSNKRSSKNSSAIDQPLPQTSAALLSARSSRLYEVATERLLKSKSSSERVGRFGFDAFGDGGVEAWLQKRMYSS